jgi:hypothetical protein
MRNLRRISQRRRQQVQKHLPRPHHQKSQPACTFARTAQGGIEAEELFLRDDELKVMEARNQRAQEIAQQRRLLFQDLGAASRECAQEYRTEREQIRDQRKKNAANFSSMSGFLDGSDGKGVTPLGDRENLLRSDSTELCAREASSPSKKNLRRSSGSSFDDAKTLDSSAPKLRKLKFDLWNDMRGEASASSDQEAP